MTIVLAFGGSHLETMPWPGGKIDEDQQAWEMVAWMYNNLPGGVWEQLVSEILNLDGDQLLILEHRLDTSRR